MASDLKAALARVQARRQNFVLFRGEEGDVLFISARAPSGKQLAELEKESGEGKRILKGVCFKEPAGLVFATRNPVAPAWEKMLTKVLQERKCSAFLPLSLRQLRSDEPEEATGDEAESTPSSPVATAAGGDEQHAWERLKSSLMPQLRTAIADPATKEKVTKIVVAAQASEKAGQYAQATAIFHRLAGVLQIEIPKPAVIRPPRAAPLQAALNKLTPAFRRAVAEKPERKKQLLQPVVVFQQQLKAGELEQARETLRQVSRVLQSVLAA